MKTRTSFAALTALLFLAPVLSTFAETAEEKAWRTNVPLFELRDASLDDSIRVLVLCTRSLDPSGDGVNFVWPPRQSLPAETRVNLRLANVPLYEVARYVGRLAGLRMDPEPHALVFTPGRNAKPPSKRSVIPAALTAQKLLLPRIEFREATLAAAIAHLAKTAQAANPGQAGVNILLDVPAETRERPITLSLNAVPLSEALRYAAQLADLTVVEEPYALVITARKPSTSPRAPAPAPRPAAAANSSAHVWTPLEKPAQPVVQGGAMRDLSGDIQPDRSGYVPNRSMGGWPLEADPWNKLGSNCRPLTTLDGKPVASSRCRSPHCPYCRQWDP